MAEVRAEAYVDGANHLAAWLRAAPETANDRKTTEELLKAAEPHVGRLELKAQPLTAVIDVDEARRVEQNVPLYVQPGEHLIVASLGTRRIERRATLGAGQVAALELSLPASPEPLAPPMAELEGSAPAIAMKETRRVQVEQPPPEAYARAIVLGLGGGATFAGLAIGTHGLLGYLAADSRSSDAKSLRTTALIGFGAAGVAGIATVAGIVWWPAWPPAARAASFNIRLVPGGLGATGEF